MGSTDEEVKVILEELRETTGSTKEAEPKVSHL